MMTHIAYHQLTEPDKLPALSCGVCGAGECLQYTTEASTDSCVTCPDANRGGRFGQLSDVSHEDPTVGAKDLSGAQLRRIHVLARDRGAHQQREPVHEYAGVLYRVPTVHYTLAGGDENNPKGMLHHWRTKHPTLEIPAELKAKVTLADKERKGILGVGKAPPVARDVDSAGKAAAHAAAVAQAAAAEAAMQQATALVAAHVGGVAGGDADGAVAAGAARA